MSSHEVPVEVHGEVAPGFESVKALFTHNMQTQRENGAQLCAYVGNQKVVDLWASKTGDASYTADSIANMFSSGKSLEAIAMAHQVGAGRVNYTDKVVDHWPEFGANGKEALTVADVMRHEAGLAAFDTAIDPIDLFRDHIKENRIGKIIESQTQHYGEKSRREYHAVTRGWIANEIFRRVEESGRTIGEFLEQTLTGPLAADVMIGVPEDQMDRVVDVTPIGVGYHFKESLKPRAMGRQVKDNIFVMGRKLFTVVPSMRAGTARKMPPPFVGMETVAAFNTKAIRMGETPSANAHGSARGLAKLAAAMANGGRLDDAELLSEKAWRAMHDHALTRRMLMMTHFTQGGVAQFRPCEIGATALDRAFNEGREGFYGWMGLGGSLFQWHPGKQIGFGFVPTALHVLDFVNERGKAYQAEVMKCAG